MRKPLVAGNWKMHGSRRFAVDLLAELAGGSETVEVAVFPPFVLLADVSAAITQRVEGDIAFGAQTVSEHESGAYTGEVSADMLIDQGCRYVLVGHSERRSLYGETSEQVAAKFVAAQAKGLIPVLCVGETLAEREQGETLDVVGAQLQAVIDAASLDAVCKAVVAYEPVWAIGTGKTATPEQAQDVHRAIREQLGVAGAQTRILYGGSVKAANAEQLFAQQDIDGALVGGASLDAAEFNAICKQAE